MKMNLRQVYDKENLDKLVGKLELQLAFTLFMLSIQNTTNTKVKEHKQMLADYKLFDLKEGYFEVAKAVIYKEMDYMFLAFNYSVNVVRSKQLLFELQTVAKSVAPKKEKHA